MLYEMIEKQKREYIDEVTFKVRMDVAIYIYGAGKISKIVSKLLDIHNIEYAGYCVSEIDRNLRELENKKVVGIEELDSSNEKILFIIATLPGKQREIIDKLEEKGYYEYVKVPSLIGYFDDSIYRKNLCPEMEITVRIGCKVNCKYCPQDKLLSKYCGERLMSFETFKICVDKLPEGTTIIFSGFAEPFLNPACVDMILYAFETKRKVKLFTTLEGLTKAQFERISKLNFDEVVLHLPDKNEFANITVDDKYIELLKLVIDSKKDNRERFISYANAQGPVSEVILGWLCDKIRITGELNDRAGNLDNEGLLTANVDLKKRRFCTRAISLNHNVLLPNGDVVVCCNDFGLTHKYGNLLQQNYEDAVINSVERNKILQSLSGVNCESVLCDECVNVGYY